MSRHYMASGTTLLEIQHGQPRLSKSRPTCTQVVDHLVKKAFINFSVGRTNHAKQLVYCLQHSILIPDICHLWFHFNFDFVR